MPVPWYKTPAEKAAMSGEELAAYMCRQLQELEHMRALARWLQRRAAKRHGADSKKGPS